MRDGRQAHSVRPMQAQPSPRSSPSGVSTPSPQPTKGWPSPQPSPRGRGGRLPLPLGEGWGEGHSRRLRVAIPLAGFNLSGGVKSLVGVANALAERGHSVRFLVPDYAATPPAALQGGVRVAVLTAGPHWLPPPTRKVIHLLRLAVTATAGADMCLANYWTTAYVALASKWLRADHAVLAYNVRGYEPRSHGLNADASLPSRIVRAALAWLSYRLPLQKICTTDWLKQQTGDSSAYVVGHGINLDVFQPASPRPAGERVVIGTIGRLGEAKGYPDFVRAVERLPADLPIEFRIAAPDPVELPTRFPATVEHPQPEREMSQFYARCDVFVFSSRGEGFGLPALEAMAVGCPVITTDSGGVRQFATPDENCLMTPPADPPALAAAITTLVHDPARRTALRAAALATAAEYSQDAVLERFCRYLEQLDAALTPTLSQRERESTPSPSGRGLG